ncbi:hypothetical protein F3J16_17265 [Burkholderia sp. Ap-962]|uniref:glycosyl hydrolase family 28-related protein n=1 Tax=Burkholderia sp. Ap-962 TaxID=2608333 RepID=UPI001420BFB9|nr:glycosyl hydrolase family 28-related protein [Burkholderia sp. Ap-962]NIF71922.1 hypothetical protein [Burkholderia sp. Ap-962]
MSKNLVVIGSALILSLSISANAQSAGSLDNTAIGATMPASGAFTSLSASGVASFDNVAISGGSISALSAPLGLAAGGTGATSALGATSQLQYQAAAVGAIARSVGSKLADRLNLKDFGAKCDGVTNDDAAFTAAFVALKPGTELDLPAGTCVFSTSHSLPVVSNVGIVGAGSGQTTLLYSGADASTDLLVVGDGTTSLAGWSLRGFTIQSSTPMTGGSALHLQRMQNGNALTDVNAGAFNQSGSNLFDGIWLDNVNVFSYDHFNIQVKNEGLKMNGSASNAEGSDIFLDHGAITFSNIGYHVGGGQGGVYFGNVLAFEDGVNYQIDNALAHSPNREIFFSDLSISDGSFTYGIYVNDALAAESPIVINGAIASAGFPVPGGGPDGIDVYIKQWGNGRVSFGPGQLYNASQDGLRVDDPTTIVTIDPSRMIFNNQGYGVNATVNTSRIGNFSQFQASNSLGNQSPGVQPLPFQGEFDHVMQYAAGQQRAIQWAAGGATRWKLLTDGTAETGSNSGSNLEFANFSDDGSFRGIPLQIDRASGAVSIANGLTVNGQDVLPLKATSGSLGGSPLAAGACTSSSVAMAGAAPGMALLATPDAYPGAGYDWHAYVSSAGGVTVELCAIAAGSPVASVYHVRAFQ